ncbi:hypothetical protein QYE47_24075, partial [Pseudomonas sp. 2,4-D]|nr:hypothetical protein [Pseudomonas sp. 2,4-D]
KGPGLLANLHPPFTVDAATVFAGKPTLTLDSGAFLCRCGPAWKDRYRMNTNDCPVPDDYDSLQGVALADTRFRCD